MVEYMVITRLACASLLELVVCQEWKNIKSVKLALPGT
jgi:hypothetical protein